MQRLRIKIFADGASLQEMEQMRQKSWVQGFTTNPSLMRKEGIEDYETFAQRALEIVEGKPISFEVLADDFAEMEEQALTIASWGENVFVKIPVMNTRGDSCAPLISRLSEAGVKLNITAVFTQEQVREVIDHLHDTTPAIVSIFAGRIADTGVDPMPLMQETARLLERRENIELLWASPREFLNLIQADACGCHIITMTKELLQKIPLLGKDLHMFSQETVQMFYRDAQAAKLQIKVSL